MAKKIALELNIGGVKQSVSSINELETAIKKAKEQLAGVEIGSQKFKDLQGEIRKAQNFAEDLNESIKPQDLEKRVGAYAKVGSAIVSSFAAAQTALSLFGAESEDVGKAATKAQQVLTLALTAREVAEGAVAIKTVAANIATIASARAATAATTATRALWATLAANPLTAIIAGLGLLITAVLAFSDASEEQKSVLEDVNQQLTQESINYQQQIILLSEVNGLRSVQNAEIEKLKKAFPGFNALLNEENLLTQKGKEFLKAKAQESNLLAKIQEAEKKILEESIILQGKDAEARLNAQIRIETLRTGIENYQKQLEKLNPIISEGTRLLADQSRKEELAKQRKEELRKKQEQLRQDFERGRMSIITFNAALKILNDGFKEYEQNLADLEKVQPSTKIVEDLKKVQDARKTATAVFVDDVKNIKESIKQVTEIPTDKFIKSYVNFRETLESLFKSGIANSRDFTEAYRDFVNKTEGLTQEQINDLDRLTRGWISLNQFLRETPGFDEVIKSLKGVDIAFDDFRDITGKETRDGYAAFLGLLGDISASLGNFAIDTQDVNKELVKFRFDPLKIQENVKTVFEKIRNGLFEPTARKLLELELKAAKIELIKTPDDAVLKGRIKALEDALKQSTLRGLKIIDEEKVKEGVDATIAEFNKLLANLDGAEGRVLAINFEVQQLTKNLKDNTEELSRSVGGIITSNIGFINTELFGLRNKEQRERKKFVDEVKKDEEGLAKFKKDLIDKGLIDASVNQKDLLDAYIAYKTAEVDATKEAEDEKERIRREKLQKIQDEISTYASYLGEIEALVSQSFANQLEFLEKSTEAQLKLVVGTSEESAKKRKEIEEKAAEDRRQIEKKATLASLRFQLVQALASSANAILSILAQPPNVPFFVKAIQVGLAAGIGTAQLAIINEQINTAQLFRKGGLVKAQGGMLLSGPTHEQGGIPLAQMGVIAEGQEAIINRNSLVNYRDLLSTINQAGGGRPLVVNSFDDTRIVEAIAEQRQKPLRAYVLQSEITNQQALSKRLDDLSKI